MTEVTTPNMEPLVTLTASAAGQVRDLLGKETDPGKKQLRLYVEPGWCSGRQYGMVFDEPRAGDLSAAQLGVPLVIDPVSADYLRGAVVDYVDALTGGGFKITNPNARQSCGCGNSFAV